MAVRISAIIPTLDLRPMPLPIGADELIVQGGRGLARARNRGAEHASGEILVFLDDDVHLEGSLDALRARPPSEVWWIPRWADGTEGDAYTARMVGWLNTMGSFGMFPASVGPFLGVRRNVFHAVGGYSTRAIHEDTELARRLHDRGFRPTVLPGVTAWILRPFSSMGKIARGGGGSGGVGPMPWLRVTPA